MMKSNLSIILIILTVICVFSVAAIADRCGCSLVPAQEKTDVGGAEEAVEEETSSTEQDVPEEAADEQEQIEKKAPEDEKQAKEEVDEEEPAEEASQQQEQLEAPTIELEIYEGPIYSSSDNVCYYRIKANVTGTPNPEVEFSKDDSGGAWGKLKCQVNLSDPTETYALAATATNSEGSDSDSIDLSWGCNRPPVISDITIHSESGIINSGQQYEVSVKASDPEGDNLEYRWSVSGGKIDSPTLNPTMWVTPSSAGEYQIEVDVEDGSDAMATMAMTVMVEQLELETNINLPIMQSEGGYIVYNQRVITGGTFYTGDSQTNVHCRALISFNIRDLAGGTIDNAAIYFNNEEVWGNPSFFKIFTISSVNWGPTLDLSDYNTPGELIISYPLSTGPDFSFSNSKLIMELQQAVDSGRVRFQIMIDLNSSTTNGNGEWDGLEYNISGVNLSVDYTP